MSKLQAYRKIPGALPAAASDLVGPLMVKILGLMQWLRRGLKCSLILFFFKLRRLDSLSLGICTTF